VALVKALIARVGRLEEENRQLKAEIERLKQPPANPRNSSQQPSRNQKSNQPSDKPKKKHGPPFGHKRSIRKLIDIPDQTISLKVEQCAMPSRSEPGRARKDRPPTSHRTT
jgi:hypothetical protein